MHGLITSVINEGRPLNWNISNVLIKSSVYGE